MIAARRDFSDRDALAAALAADIAVLLTTAVAAKGTALLAVSGGTTPKLLFRHLSRAALPWEKVTVTLVDERAVPETSERSNSRLVRENLLVGEAARATFVPLYGNELNAALLGPFDAVILGMGNDGHTASFFPGGDKLDAALDPRNTARILPINAQAAGEPRLTFSLAALLESAFIALHIEGKDKRMTLERAVQDGPVEDMPVRAVLRSAHPVTIYWSA